MRRERIADWCAGALAVVVLVLGGLIVVKPAIDDWETLYRSTPFEVGKTTQTVERRTPGERVETTTTTTEASSSFAERLLGRSGLLLVRLALVALLAFLAAAVLQRAILGSYGLQARPAGLGAPVAAEVPAGAPQDAKTEVVPIQNGQEAAREPAGANLAAVAKLVASRREALGLSQRELAKRAGISHTVVSRIESGEHSPSPRTLERLANALR
jgi:DNA-binding XRE family transcriptional regulator